MHGRARSYPGFAENMMAKGQCVIAGIGDFYGDNLLLLVFFGGRPTYHGSTLDSSNLV